MQFRQSNGNGNAAHMLQNAAARLICRLRRFDHVTDALVSLHWLRVPERVVYKIAVLTFKAICMGSHRSISDQLFVSPICLVDSLFALLALTAWWCHRLNCQQLALERSRWPVLAYGIVCQQTVRRHRCCRPSANDQNSSIPSII